MSEELTFAVDLLWVRPGMVGGTEVVIRHILDGWRDGQESFHAVLIVSQDNAESFASYGEDERFSLLTAPVKSAGIAGRIIWQNLHLSGFLKKNGLTDCFSPVYDRPYLNLGIRYITTVHDIQAYHYPEYHPFHEVAYSKMIWRADRKRSVWNICISDHVRQDIVKEFRFRNDRLDTIYDPVTLDPTDQADFDEVKGKYGIEEGEYFYTVSQMIPHKNTVTLLKVFAAIRDRNEPLPRRLLISGISGNASEEVRRILADLKLEDIVTLTGYVSDSERNSLCSHCRAFLFPSVFEGFGMPPVEAMMLGVPVITTRCTCIPEVTQELADYVSDPYDADEWIGMMKAPSNRSGELDASRYDRNAIAARYLEVIRKNFSDL